MAEEEKKEEAQKEEKAGAEKSVEQQAAAAESWLADFFAFRTLITRPFIKIIYVIGALFVTIGSLVMMLAGPVGGGANAALGLIYLVLGNIAWRVMCEVWIVFFKMYDVLKSIADKTKSQ